MPPAIKTDQAVNSGSLGVPSVDGMPPAGWTACHDLDAEKESTRPWVKLVL
ncbi:unnamed protein product [Diplocarpon coronariae]